MLKIIRSLAVVALLAPTAAMADGDVKLGKKVFKKCSACHSKTEGKHKVGPSIYNIVGAKSGAAEGYSYSEAMSNINLTWDAATLRAFLRKPKDVVPKTSMSFSGLKDEEDLDNIIAYLKSLAAN